MEKRSTSLNSLAFYTFSRFTFVFTIYLKFTRLVIGEWL